MSQPEDIQILVADRLQQSQDAVSEGRLLMQSKFYKGAINRFYYAMFYAVLALLVARQLETSKHKGVISLFDRDFVKPGIFNKEMSVWLHSSFELRLTADYAELTDISAAQAEECYSQASEFLQRVRDFLTNSERS
ncbi:HEPN domain-containing protein [Leptolyngbya sp. PCC 6406]|uniref:HEPN domain-containing protein n=1 Tax=Leptolyngbya sp. PCC 6406 TaxID=1173264 RepID=UPI0002ACB122|nr:HEPN domain-containing protein [Leptolyngbya sp. PCC 6406]